MSSATRSQLPSYAEVVRGVTQTNESPSNSEGILTSHASVDGSTNDPSPLVGNGDSNTGCEITVDSGDSSTSVSKSAQLPAKASTAPVTRSRTTRSSTRAAVNAQSASTYQPPRASRSKKKATVPADPANDVHLSPVVTQQSGTNNVNGLLPAVEIGDVGPPSTAQTGPITFAIPLNGCFNDATVANGETVVASADVGDASNDIPGLNNSNSTPNVARDCTPDRPSPLDCSPREVAPTPRPIQPHPTLGFPTSPVSPEHAAVAKAKVDQINLEAAAAAAAIPDDDEEQNPLNLVPDVLSSDSEPETLLKMFDDEAIESDDGVEMDSAESDGDGEDDYDRTDPFINDGPLSEMETEDDEDEFTVQPRRTRLKRKRQSASTSANTIVDSGSESESNVRPRNRARHSDDMLSPSAPHTMDDSPSLIDKRIQELIRKDAVRLGKQKVSNNKLFGSDVPLPEGLSDADRQDHEFLNQIRTACDENTRIAIEKANQDAFQAFKESLRLSKALEGMSSVIPVDEDVAVDDGPSSSLPSQDQDVDRDPSAPTVTVPAHCTPTSGLSVTRDPALPSLTNTVPAHVDAPSTVHAALAPHATGNHSSTSSTIGNPSPWAEMPLGTNSLLQALLERIALLEARTSSVVVSPPVTPVINPNVAPGSHTPANPTPPLPYPSPSTPLPMVSQRSNVQNSNGGTLKMAKPSVSSEGSSTASTPVSQSKSPSSAPLRQTPAGPQRSATGTTVASSAPSTPSAPNGPRRTFRAAADQLSPMGGSLPADLWSLPGNLPPAKLPSECAVSRKYPYGAFLQEHSDGLPNLSEGLLLKWTDTKGPGYFIYERWGDQCPDLDFDLTTRAALFRRFHNCANLSREDPSLFTARRLSGKAGRYHLYLNNKPALCFTLVYTTKSLLIAPEGQVLRQKYILGIPMIGDFHRLEAALCMIFHQSKLSAQLGMNALQFATKVDFTVGSSKGRSSAMFAETSSGNEGSRVRDNSFTLDNTADVPVYDLRRNPDFNFDTDLAGVHRLPRFQGEIPDGSCVSVAYTVSTFITKGKKSVGLNIQFALVLGVPPEGESEDDSVGVDNGGDGESGDEVMVSVAP